VSEAERVGDLRRNREGLVARIEPSSLSAAAEKPAAETTWQRRG
jgi:hypothetical protein